MNTYEEKDQTKTDLKQPRTRKRSRLVAMPQKTVSSVSLIVMTAPNSLCNWPNTPKPADQFNTLLSREKLSPLNRAYSVSENARELCIISGFTVYFVIIYFSDEGHHGGVCARAR